MTGGLYGRLAAALQSPSVQQLLKGRHAIVVAVVVMVLGYTAASSTQSHADRESSLAFEVASIRPATRESARQGGSSSPTRFHAAAITLRTALGYAYGMDEFRILGGPDWVSSEWWEISARTDRARSGDELRAMVRSLLADRFGL